MHFQAYYACKCHFCCYDTETIMFKPAILMALFAVYLDQPADPEVLKETSSSQLLAEFKMHSTVSVNGVRDCEANCFFL